MVSCAPLLQRARLTIMVVRWAIKRSMWPGYEWSVSLACSLSDETFTVDVL